MTCSAKHWRNYEPPCLATQTIPLSFAGKPRPPRAPRAKPHHTTPHADMGPARHTPPRHARAHPCTTRENPTAGDRLSCNAVCCCTGPRFHPIKQPFLVPFADPGIWARLKAPYSHLLNCGPDSQGPGRPGFIPPHRGWNWRAAWRATRFLPHRTRKATGVPLRVGLTCFCRQCICGSPAHHKTTDASSGARSGYTLWHMARVHRSTKREVDLLWKNNPIPALLLRTFLFFWQSKQPVSLRVPTEARVSRCMEREVGSPFQRHNGVGSPFEKHHGVGVSSPCDLLAALVL